MRTLIVTALSFSALATTFAQGQPPRDVVVTHNGEQASARGPAHYFTGSARIDPLFDAKAPSRVTGVHVTS